MEDTTPRLMRPVGASRQRRQVGDLFEVEFQAGRLLGRVIRTDAVVFEGASGLNLLYFFRGLAAAHRLESADVSAQHLLIPPLMTNNLGWSRGYFRTIGNRPLLPGEVLDQHCFDAFGEGFFDEYGKRLRKPVEPVGVRAVHSYLTIEHELSVALGWGGTVS